ncbi:MAG: hypothetical protein KJ995_06600, partial [Candidatus Omnitrophica bacterium]|nr:hypothetical protein [Candidatus Omnitrophota bacterium]
SLSGAHAMFLFELPLDFAPLDFAPLDFARDRRDQFALMAYVRYRSISHVLIVGRANQTATFSPVFFL